MATVRMVKGRKYADVYDSPETIRQAQREGYSLVDAPAAGDGGPASREDRAGKDGKRK